MQRVLLRSLAPSLRQQCTTTTAKTQPHPAMLAARSRIIPALSVHARFAASSVAGRPGSQTFGHAAQNVKEEVGGSAADFARAIAGGNMTSDSVEPTTRTFMGITSSVATSVPKPYVAFGLLGGLPYVGTAGVTVYSAYQAGLAASGALPKLDPGVALTMLDQALNVQMTYGAVMLSFLGALHWGMEFAGYGGHKGYPRLILGALPVLYAWPTLALQPTTALIAQWAGFTGLWWADLRATNAGWTPKWYSQYRFYLSILVGTCIIGSLAGTSYYGPVAGHGLLSHDLELIRSQRAELVPERKGQTKGPVSAVSDNKSDAFVVLKDSPKKDEGKEEDAAKSEEPSKQD